MLGEAPQNPSGPLKVYEVPITQSHGGRSSTPGLLRVHRISSLGVRWPQALHVNFVFNLECCSANISNPVLARLALSQQGQQGVVSGGSLWSFISLAPPGLGWNQLSESGRSPGETPRDHELPPPKQEKSLS